MAITINQAPFNFSGFRQRNNLIIATSSNIAQNGFKYKVTVIAGQVQMYEGYISPNPEDALVFDLYPVLSQIGSMIATSAGNNLHKFSSPTTILTPEQYPFKPLTYEAEPVIITVDEAWTVGGVLTDNPDIHAAEVVTRIMYNRCPQFIEGYRPNPTGYAQFTSTTNKFMTDRRWDTLRWDKSQSVGLGAPGTSRIYTRVTKDDYGVWSIPYTSQGTRSGNDLPNYAATQVRVSLLPFNQSPIDYTESLSTMDDGVVHIACYPANILASTISGLSAIKSAINSGNWYALYVRLLNSGGSAVSVNHIMYNAEYFGESDCRHDNVRLGWLNGEGGWDYFNFIKRSENSYQIERKQFKSIEGNYATADGGATPFAIHQYQRGVTQTQATTQRYLDITSDWLTEGEFALMTSLVTSPDVYIIDSSGVARPVIVDNSSHTEKRERTGKKYNVTIRIRHAQDYYS